MLPPMWETWTSSQRTDLLGQAWAAEGIGSEPADDENFGISLFLSQSLT